MTRTPTAAERAVLEALAAFERSPLVDRVAGVHVPRETAAGLLDAGLLREVTHEYGRPGGLVVARITPAGLIVLYTPHPGRNPQR